MNIDVRHLRVALAALEHGSFRRAAERLGVRQSSVSRRIRDLEAMLGVTLFVRNTSGVRVTPAGQHYLTHAQDALDRLARAHQIAATFWQGGDQIRGNETGLDDMGSGPTTMRILAPAYCSLKDTDAALARIEALLEVLSNAAINVRILPVSSAASSL